MEFGQIPVADAAGAILAHSVKHGSGLFKKGRTLSRADILILRDSGVLGQWINTARARLVALYQGV